MYQNNDQLFRPFGFHTPTAQHDVYASAGAPGRSTLPAQRHNGTSLAHNDIALLSALQTGATQPMVHQTRSLAPGLSILPAWMSNHTPSGLAVPLFGTFQ